MSSVPDSLRASRERWKEQRRELRLAAGMRPRAATVGLDDVGTTHPDLVPEWHPDNPKPITYYRKGSNFRAKWECATGHVWETKIVHRTNGNGCIKCRSKMSDEEYRQRRAEQFAAWYYGRDPDEARTFKSRNARVQAVNRAHGTMCYLCRAEVLDVAGCHVDHVMPRSKGGPDELWNLRITHPQCNLSKGDSEYQGPIWFGYQLAMRTP